MKYTFAFAIALFLFIAGCFHEPKVKECGADVNCFAESLVACTPAKVKTLEKNINFEMLVKGPEADKCSINIKVVDAEVPILKDKDMTCLIPRDQITNTDSLFQGEKLFKTCKGSLIDLLISLGVKPSALGSGAGTLETQSQSYWSSAQPLAITNFRAFGTILELEVQNNAQEAIMLTEISGSGLRTFSTPIEFVSGTFNVIKIDLTTSCGAPGTRYSFGNITITYNVGSLSGKKFVGQRPLVGTCQ